MHPPKAVLLFIATTLSCCIMKQFWSELVISPGAIFFSEPMLENTLHKHESNGPSTWLQKSTFVTPFSMFVEEFEHWDGVSFA